MSENGYTRVTAQSWFSRIAALLGIILGLIFILTASVLLFWNARQSTKICKTIKKSTEAVLSVPADRVDPANQGKLVHVNGRAITVDRLTDPVFGVSVNALMLRRKVEMYQWVEKKSSDAATTYSKAWSGHPISSSSFKKPSGHENPGLMPYQNAEQLAAKITLGAFTLPTSVIRKISGTQQVPVSSDIILPEDLTGRAHQYEGGLYIGDNPAAPQIGDIQIRFVIVPQEELTVLAQQSGSSLIFPQASTSKDMFAVREGLLTARQMFHKAEQKHIHLTWKLRLLGFLLMFLGVGITLKILAVRPEPVPFFGKIAGAGSGIISFLISGILFLITMAAAWITFRPLLGIALLTLAAVLVLLVKYRGYAVGFTTR